MSRTITAMFDSRADAEAGKERLRVAGLDASHVHIHDQSTHQTQGDYSTHQDRGTWAAIKNAFLPDEDRHGYDEAIRRGGYVLTADVDDDKADDAVRALENADAVDIDDRMNSYRESGWDYRGGTSGGGTGLFGSRDADTDRLTSDGYDRDRLAGERTGSEEAIPVVEEQLVVGKREVASGGARVRSYVTETPVHEQVRLREERINVERRPVDQPLDTADADAFRERTIEMTATSEEAVIGKNARVVEEVVLSKTAGERTEEIEDTVRRTDVEVDDDVRQSGFGSDSNLRRSDEPVDGDPSRIDGTTGRDRY